VPAAPADDVIVQFVRSGGAGGQNVNKGACPR
jgi:protein subunit release factor B